jgi:hypothetical protein
MLLGTINFYLVPKQKTDRFIPGIVFVKELKRLGLNIIGIKTA